ncbi:MAG: DUF2848 domain-containing protein [Reyranella sp.]|jgi:hypothetical protein|uniref:DUF2848 domain-containing protein n=1 Tax=Reyranella sp. TaxID=1929291 RepID=UPI0025E43B32|nr:DUF2848 domain-containing protein [Reyranella sp.]MBR2818958.1 DUF2848 domain-containing protein [Reyranella sp.]
MARLEFDGHAKGAIEKVAVEIENLIIAGWTGRDVTALNHHIEELKAIGVQPPSRVPIYYRVAAQMLTQADRIQVLGDDSSGEVEPVLVGADNRLWVTVGADHTDRKVESYGIAVSKQMCAKPIGRTAWRFEEVEPHWDRLMLRSFIQEDGRKVLYQEGPLAKIRDPRELIFGWKDEKRLPMGAAMFCGTMPAIGAIRSSSRFEMELDDPVLGRKISHAYTIEALPVIS